MAMKPQRTITDFRPCPAASVGEAVSTMPATTATGGAPRRAVQAAPGTGAWATTTTAWAGATTSRHSCFRCAVFGTLRPRNSAAIASRRPDPRLLRHRAYPLYSVPPKSPPASNPPIRPAHGVYS